MSRPAGRIRDVLDGSATGQNLSIHLDDPVQCAIGKVSGGRLGFLVVPALLFRGKAVAAFHDDRGLHANSGKRVSNIADTHRAGQVKSVAHHHLRNAVDIRGLRVVGQKVGLRSIQSNLHGCETEGGFPVNFYPDSLIGRASAQIGNGCCIVQAGTGCVAADGIGIHPDIAHKLHVLVAQSVSHGRGGQIPVSRLIGCHLILVAADRHSEAAVRGGDWGNGAAGGVIHAADHGHSAFRLLLLARQLSAPDLAVNGLTDVTVSQQYVAIFSVVIGINAGAIVDLEVFVSRRHEHTGLHIHRVGQGLALTASQGTHIIGEAIVLAVIVRIRDVRCSFCRNIR